MTLKSIITRFYRFWVFNKLFSDNLRCRSLNFYHEVLNVVNQDSLLRYLWQNKTFLFPIKWPFNFVLVYKFWPQLELKFWNFYEIESDSISRWELVTIPEENLVLTLWSRIFIKLFWIARECNYTLNFGVLLYIRRGEEIVSSDPTRSTQGWRKSHIFLYKEILRNKIFICSSMDHFPCINKFSFFSQRDALLSGDGWLCEREERVSSCSSCGARFSYKNNIRVKQLDWFRALRTFVRKIRNRFWI